MQKFWDPDRLLSSGASYNIAIGRACVGKSFAMRKKIIEHYIKTGEQSTYIVRFDITISHTAKYLFDQFNGYIINTQKNGCIWPQITIPRHYRLLYIKYWIKNCC